jgi:hypothetical protein
MALMPLGYLDVARALGLIDRSQVVADPPAFVASAPQATGAASNTLGGSNDPTTVGSIEPIPDTDKPKGALAVEAAPRAESTAEQPMTKKEKETGVADDTRFFHAWLPPLIHVVPKSRKGAIRWRQTRTNTTATEREPSRVGVSSTRQAVTPRSATR